MYTTTPAQGETIGGSDGRVNIWLYDQAAAYNPIGGNAYAVPIRYGMIEFVQPASQSEQSAGGAIDPTTGQQIAGPGAPTNIALPLVAGRNIVRYFIGLRDNTSAAAAGVTGRPVRNANYHGYANRYDDAGDVNINQDNRTTLFKAVVQPYIPDPNNAGKYIPNIGLFHTLNADNSKGSDPTRPIVLDDPNFFYDSTIVGPEYAVPGYRDINGDGKVEIWENWAAVSQSLLPTTKADVIALERDDNNQIVYRDNAGNITTTGGFPVVRPLISFTPQYVENDPGVPASLESAGAETPYTAATQFRTQYPAWTTPFRVFVYRSPDGKQDALSGANPLNYEMAFPTQIDYYVGSPTNPTVANVGPILLDPNSGLWKLNQTFKPEFFAFTVDPDKGTVNFAFPHTVLDYDANSNPKPVYYNPATINSRIDPNSVNPASATANGEPFGKRFLWLRDYDGNNTQNPAAAKSPVKEFYVDPTTTQPYKVRIVAGSERVFGPDQNPGAHYGYRTQYTRVSANAGQIGRNQYKILYENGPNAASLADPSDPRVQTGYIEFDSQPDVDADANGGSPNLNTTGVGNVEDPAGTISGTPVYRPHSLPQLKVAGGVNVAADAVEVSYSFQMNRPNDVVKVDYLTRSILNVSMEMRLYDPRSARPQTVQLTSKIGVRNLPR